MGPVITPNELAAVLRGEHPPVLLDVRWKLGGPPGREEYGRGHLPGAVYVDLDTELAAAPGEGGRHPLPEPDSLERTLRSAGVSDDSAVVAYDADDGSSAARAWWLLRWAGHSDVAVLDGGYAAWQRLGLPVATETPHPRKGDVRVRPGEMPVLDASQAAECARNGLLLDARPAPRYRGESEPIDPRSGHVPGAVNAPFTEHVDADGRWRSPEDLAKRFAGLGVAERGPTGAYCGSGVTASSVVLALEHAGLRDSGDPAALYPGSWSHWSRHPEWPAETGENPG